jgi:hypothetical protein
MRILCSMFIFYFILFKKKKEREEDMDVYLRMNHQIVSYNVLKAYFDMLNVQSLRPIPSYCLQRTY